jgi:hypothetical protein
MIRSPSERLSNFNYSLSLLVLGHSAASTIGTKGKPRKLLRLLNFAVHVAMVLSHPAISVTPFPETGATGNGSKRYAVFDTQSDIDLCSPELGPEVNLIIPY